MSCVKIEALPFPLSLSLATYFQEGQRAHALQQTLKGGRTGGNQADETTV